MEKFNSLSDLFMEELSDLLNAESQWVEALLKMSDASRLPALKNTLKDCLKITKGHVNRIQVIFNDARQNPQKHTSKTMKILVTESEDILNRAERGNATDAAIISVAQRVQQYEISRYKTVREHAADLGHTKIVELFTKTLNEERAINFHLNELSQEMINLQAIGPGGFHQMPDQRKEF